MATDLEEQLRRHFTQDAARITAPADLAMQVRRRARRQRSMAVALSAAAAAGVVVVGLWAVGGTGPGGGTGVGLGAGSGVMSSQAPSSGLTTTGSAASCAQEFSPQALAQAGFAFDGTVVAIGESVTFDFERRVTFKVHHWYAGQRALTKAGSEQVDGSGDLLIDMPAPDGAGSVTSEGLAYAVGERLLVSGAVREGQSGFYGPVGWGCGFTGTYDTSTAQTWQDAFAGDDATGNPQAASEGVP